MRVRLPIIVGIALNLLAGCSTYSVDRYAVSVDAQEQLLAAAHSNSNQKVAVDSFTATTPSQTEIGCRAVGPIKTPDGNTFEEYIRKALIDQLKLAQMYLSDASIRIRGNVDKVNFSSHEGVWYLQVTISDSKGKSFVVSENYDYKSSYYGETACNQTAQAFMPAVQNLVVKIVSDSAFKEMIGQQPA